MVDAEIDDEGRYDEKDDKHENLKTLILYLTLKFLFDGKIRIMVVKWTLIIYLWYIFECLGIKLERMEKCIHDLGEENLRKKS